MKKPKIELSDIFLVIGITTLCLGVAMLNIPAAVILLGIIIIVLAFGVIKPNKGG